jgi:hypothetical protein
MPRPPKPAPTIATSVSAGSGARGTLTGESHDHKARLGLWVAPER